MSNTFVPRIPEFEAVKFDGTKKSYKEILKLIAGKAFDAHINFSLVETAHPDEPNKVYRHLEMSFEGRRKEIPAGKWIVLDPPTERSNLYTEPITLDEHIFERRFMKPKE